MSKSYEESLEELKKSIYGSSIIDQTALTAQALNSSFNSAFASTTSTATGTSLSQANFEASLKSLLGSYNIDEKEYLKSLGVKSQVRKAQDTSGLERMLKRDIR